MKKILMLLISITIIILPACKKIFKNEYHVTGQIIDKFSEEPVRGAHVELLATAGAGTGYGVVDTFPTDNEGCFDFWFSPAEDLVYDIRPAYYEYYDNHGAEKHVGLFEKNRNHTLELHPLGWVKVNFINEPPLDTAYNLSINGFNNNPPAIWSVSIDTSLYGELRSKTQSSVHVFVTKGGIEDVYTHDLYVMPHDTIFIDIKY